MATDENKTNETGNVVSLSFINNNVEMGKKAELIWAMLSIVCNISAASSDIIAPAFHVMFPGEISSNYTMSRTKLGYIISEALGPYFRNMFLKDAESSYYTVLYDETVNNKGLKELQLKIIYYSEVYKKVIFGIS